MGQAETDISGRNKAKFMRLKSNWCDLSEICEWNSLLLFSCFYFVKNRFDGGGFLSQTPVGGHEGIFRESLRQYRAITTPGSIRPSSIPSFKKGQDKEKEREYSTRQSMMDNRLCVPKFRLKTLYVDPSPIEIDRRRAFQVRPKFAALHLACFKKLKP